jgi:hypothetical protein
VIELAGEQLSRCSASRRSVMSVAIPTDPITAPLRSRSGLRMDDTGATVPSCR